MIVFKLERERPAYATHGGTLYYVKDRYLRTYEFANQRDNPLISIRRPGSNSTNQGPRSMAYNPAENAVLICYDAEGGSYELYQIPKDAASRGDAAPLISSCARLGLKAGCGIFSSFHREESLCSAGPPVKSDPDQKPSQ
eukprot:scaffold511335_cov51-Prasinocladus_malaysianus.AAC.1